MLPKASLAVTVTVPAVPAVLEEAKPETTRLLAAAGLMLRPLWLPVIELVAVSVAVRDWLPAVLSRSLEHTSQAQSRLDVLSAGRTAWESLVVKCALPAWPADIWHLPSLPTRRSSDLVPAVLEEAKPETTRLLAAAGLMLRPLWLPVIELVAVSVAVTDWLPAVLS